MPEDAGEIRWVEDDDALAEAFTYMVERKVKKDATCELAGVTYEVPGHLRGRQRGQRPLARACGSRRCLRAELHRRLPRRTEAARLQLALM